MRREGQPIGVLSVQSYTPDAYSQEDLRTLQALADYCGGALERIQAEAEVLEAHHLLERRVQERTAELRAANEALAQSEQKYRRLHESMTDAFVSVDYDRAHHRGQPGLSGAARLHGGRTARPDVCGSDAGEMARHGSANRGGAGSPHAAIRRSTRRNTAARTGRSSRRAADVLDPGRQWPAGRDVGHCARHHRAQAGRAGAARGARQAGGARAGAHGGTGGGQRGAGARARSVTARW